MKTALLLVLLVCITHSARAETFYWKNHLADSTYFSWQDPASWVVGTRVSGTNPDNLYPQADDYIHIMREYQSYACYDLDGVTHSIKGISWADFNNDWGHRHLKLKNGTLEMTETFESFRTIMTVENAGKFKLASTCVTTLGWDAAAANTFTVNDGGELDLGGTIEMGTPRFYVKSGGKMVFQPSTLTLGKAHTGGYTDRIRFNNYGTMEFPETLQFTNGDGHTAYAIVDFEQKGGTMQFGAQLTKAANLCGVFYLELDGGTLAVTCDFDTAFFNNVNMTNEGASATMDVAANKTLTVANMGFGADAALTKAGAGKLVFGASQPATLALSAGSVEIAKPHTYSAMSFASDTKLVIKTKGVVINSPSNYTGAELEFTTDDMQYGETVLTSDDQTFLAAVRDAATVTGGQKLMLKDNTRLVLSVDPASQPVFTSSGAVNLSNAAAWGGTVPAAGTDVFVSGVDTIAVLDADAPQFGSISVLDGATLKIAKGTEITLNTTVKLYYNARFYLSGRSVSLPAGSVVAYASADELPVMELDGGGHFKAASNFEYKNVHLKAKDAYLDLPGGNVYYGTANNGETAYFRMTAENTRIDHAGSAGNGNNLNSYWVSPHAGGRVIVPNGIYLKNCSIMGTWNQKWQFYIGYQNPSDIDFNLTLDGRLAYSDGTRDYVSWEINASGIASRICGGAHIICKNGGAFALYAGNRGGATYSNVKIYENATMSFEGENSWFDCNYTVDNYGISYYSSVAGTEQMTFKDGGTWRLARGGYLNPNQNSVFVFSDGFWDVVDKSAQATTGSEINEVFAGLNSVRVESGKSVGIRSHHYASNANRDWNRTKNIANVPVTGDNGSLFVTNATPGYSMEAIMTCGNNTATGNAWAEASADGCKLVFADNSNWAGTVLADENVELRESSGDAAPAHATFGRITFRGAFPIRVWKLGGVRNDTVTITNALTAGKGGFAPVLMDGGKFAVGDTIVLGTCPASALPANYARKFASRKWKMTASPAVEGQVTLSLTYDPLPLVLILQ